LQTTLATLVRLDGHGLHTGAPVRLVILPAPAGHGIRFRRSDIRLGNSLVPARWDNVIQTALNTRIENRDGTAVATIEHLMAALSGCGVHNALVDLDGPEVPILDGSAAPFARAILRAGLARQAAPLRAIKVLRTVQVNHGDATATLSPAAGLEIDFAIAFDDAAIGAQAMVLDMANGAFLRELCDSRTFCRQTDVDQMRAQGLGLGGSLDNAVVVDGDRVLNPGGLRHPDEAVRHKMLDALGDLATAGAPLLARYQGVRAGHALTNRLLCALFADPGNWAMVPVDAGLARRLPGSDLGPADLAAVA